MEAGILPHQGIVELIRTGALSSNPGIAPHQIQPASLDLRLATVGYRVRSGFLPERRPVADFLEEQTLYRFDLTDGAILERGHAYVLPLLEQVTTPLPYQIRANPERDGKPPVVQLDRDFYTLVDEMEARFPHGAPSLVACDSFQVQGDVAFGANETVQGAATVRYEGDGQATVPDGTVITGKVKL